MKLSVVIPTLNKAELLGRTLGALRRQELPADLPWEIVVVNDGSSDGTADLLSAAASLPGPTLTVVAPAHNVGRARARNLGARAARGRWLLFMDDDIVAPPGLVAAHLALLEANPGWGTIGRVVTDPKVWDSPLFDYLDSRGVGRLPAGPAPARFFVTQNAAVPREAFLAVGGFDEEFSAYGFEDMEVAFRLEDRAGVRFQCLTTPTPRHAHHHTVSEYFAKKVECGRHSLAHVARLHPGRVAEMNLRAAVDVPEAGALGGRDRLVRALADSPLGRGLPGFLARWPAVGRRPVLRPLYHRLMSLAVLGAFRRGLRDSAGMTK